MRHRQFLRGLRPWMGNAAARLSLTSALVALLAVAAGGATLDFSAELQELDAGAHVERVVLSNGATMDVVVENSGHGPDLAVVFDSAHPTDGSEDLGTPNEDFGG